MANNDSEKKLVTVAVFTFNSRLTIVETLNSILQQDCSSIELIVSDDFSVDGTQQIVSAWVAKNSASFRSCHLLFSSINLGICQSVKRAFSKASGEWIKLIAGDDLLLPDAMSHLSSYASEAASDVGVIIGRVQSFFVGTDNLRNYGEISPSELHYSLLNTGAPELSEVLARKNLIPAPGVFVRRAFFEKYGGVDEHFVHLDDWPLWLNFLRNGARFICIPEIIILYRIHGTSISAKQSACFMNSQFLNDQITFYHRYQKRYLSNLERIDRSVYIFRWQLALGIFRKRPTVYRLTTMLHILSPLQWIRGYLAVRAAILNYRS